MLELLGWLHGYLLSVRLSLLYAPRISVPARSPFLLRVVLPVRGFNDISSPPWPPKGVAYSRTTSRRSDRAKKRK